MQFDLVSPERSLASYDATSVQVPGADGDMTVMTDHAPTITTLRPGLLRVETGSETQDYVVTGGFAEITAQGISVLAEQAIRRNDMTQGALDAIMADAQENYNRAKGGETGDDAAKLVADIAAVGTELGLTVKPMIP